jgi:Tol biopolymer transport system component
MGDGLRPSPWQEMLTAWYCCSMAQGRQKGGTMLCIKRMVLRLRACEWNRILLSLAGVLAPVLVALLAGGCCTPPAGGRIAFTSDRDGDYEIWLMLSNGTGLTMLTNNPARDRDPAWSPDGGRIAFVSDRDGVDHIYVMDANGSNVAQWTTGAYADRWPTWAPDGHTLAFVQFDGDRSLGLFAVDEGGTNQRQILTDFVLTPDWSPDGSSIALACIYPTGICVVNADGTGLTYLTTTADWDGDPDWSPDGTRIAFTRDEETLNYVYAMNADGSGLIRLTDRAYSQEPTWSADASQIGFATDRDGNWEIYRMKADGSGQTNLTNHAANDESPDWARPAAP